MSDYRLLVNKIFIVSIPWWKFLVKPLCWQSVRPSVMWARRSCCFNITWAALLTLVSTTEPQHSYTADKPVREVMMLHCILEELRLLMADCAKINDVSLCFVRPAYMQRKSETQTRGFLSECSCCLLVYWVRIYYSAIFLCYVLQSRREMERERERGRETERGA